MADPYAQFADAPASPKTDPYSQFQDVPAQAKVEPRFNYSPGEMRESVRARIAKLPQEQRAAALQEWADQYVRVERKKEAGLVQNVTDKLRNVAQGVPVLGSYLDEANAATADIVHRVTGGSYGAPYDEAKAYQDATDRAINADATHLFTVPTNRWTGGTLPDIPVSTADVARLAGTASVAKALPMITAMRGETIIPATVNSLVNGVAYGALHGSGEGNSLEERGVNALFGGAVGGAIGSVAPALSRGVANVYGAARNAVTPLPDPLKPYSRQAINNVRTAAIDDGVIDPSASANRSAPAAYDTQAIRLGPESTLADMGPNLASEAGGIASLPGRGKKLIGETLGRTQTEGRRGGASERIKSDADLVLGPAQNTVEAEMQARAIGSQRAKPFYDQFYKTEIKPTEQLIELLHRIPEGIWRDAQQLARAEGVELRQVINTGRGIDLLKRGLDDYVKSLERGTNAHRVFSGLTRDIVAETDRILSPQNPATSPWARARSESGDWIQFREGMESGREAFKSGTHPDQMRADLGRASPMMRSGYEVGARAQVRDIIGNSATSFGPNGDSAARRALGSEYARQKLDIIADRTPLRRSATTEPEPTTSINQVSGGATDYTRVDPARLTNRLDTESTFEGTRQKVLGNSVTAERTAAQKRYVAPGEAGRLPGSRESLYGDVKYAIGRAVNALSGNFLAERALIRAADAAEMLMAQGAKRDEIAHALIRFSRQERASAEVKRAIERVGKDLLAAARTEAIERRQRSKESQGNQVLAR